jgi:hypothetical protein
MENLSLSEIKELLDREAFRINNLDFISRDPVQFPRRFERLQDIEIVSLLSATIAWGNRKMICANCEKMLSLMEYRPFDYVMDKGYEELPDMNYGVASAAALVLFVIILIVTMINSAVSKRSVHY